MDLRWVRAPHHNSTCPGSMYLEEAEIFLFKAIQCLPQVENKQCAKGKYKEKDMSKPVGRGQSIGSG